MQNAGYYKSYKGFLNEEESLHLSQVIRTNENMVKSIPIPEYDDNDYTGLTKYHSVYNWLNHPLWEPLDLPTRIHNLPEFKGKPISIQCWGNILRQGEHLRNIPRNGGRTNLLCTQHIPLRKHHDRNILLRRTGVYTKRGRGVDCVNLRYTTWCPHPISRT